jgi:hypothetical protein
LENENWKTEKRKRGEGKGDMALRGPECLINVLSAVVRRLEPLRPNVILFFWPKLGISESF